MIQQDHVEAGVCYLARVEVQFPGRLERLLTHRIDGLGNADETIRVLADERDGVEAFVEVHEE